MSAGANTPPNVAPPDDEKNVCDNAIEDVKNFTHLSDFDWLNTIFSVTPQNGNANTQQQGCRAPNLDELSNEQLVYLCALEHSVQSMLRYKRPKDPDELQALENFRSATVQACSRIDNEVTDKRVDKEVKSYWTFKNIMIFFGVVVGSSLILASVVLMLKSLHRKPDANGNCKEETHVGRTVADGTIETAEKMGAASSRMSGAAAATSNATADSVTAARGGMLSSNAFATEASSLAPTLVI